MQHLILEPETALALLLILLRAAAYFLAGFALLVLFTYVVFLCLEIFPLRPRAKAKIAKVPPQLACASVVEQSHNLISAETPILTEAASIAGEELGLS